MPLEHAPAFDAQTPLILAHAAEDRRAVEANLRNADAECVWRAGRDLTSARLGIGECGADAGERHAEHDDGDVQKIASDHVPTP